MSHVQAMTGISFANLSMLARAVEKLGGELHVDTTTYKWYGTHVGDYPLPTGFSKEEMGKCEHMIRIPESKYEIGVVKSRDPENPGWTLLYDFWGTGQKLKDWLGGEDCRTLREAYSDVAIRQTAIMKKAKKVHKADYSNAKGEKVVSYTISL